VRTARLAREYDLDVRHTMFPLHPDTPPEGLTLEQLFGDGRDLATARARMEALMRTEGLPYGHRTHTYNSRKAQEMAKWAESQDGGGGVHDALYRAYFVDGKNLAVSDNVAAVAAGIGLKSDDALHAIESGDFAPAVDADWRRSREIGVRGVPTFVVGRSGVVGAQPYEVLERLVLDGGARTNQEAAPGG